MTTASPWAPAAPRSACTARNWALVKALVLDRKAPVSHVFIYAPLRRRLLLYAISTDEPASVIRRASEIMSQPGDSLPHDDHMHVRIACSAGEQDPPRHTAGRSGGRGKPKGHHGRH